MRTPNLSAAVRWIRSHETSRWVWSVRLDGSIFLGVSSRSLGVGREARRRIRHALRATERIEKSRHLGPMKDDAKISSRRQLDSNLLKCITSTVCYWCEDVFPVPRRMAPSSRQKVTPSRWGKPKSVHQRRNKLNVKESGCLISANELQLSANGQARMFRRRAFTEGC